MRKNLQQTVSNIDCYNAIEKQHIEEALNWLNANEPIYRIEKPNIPAKHLVCYFVLFDRGLNKILLVDHINAQLWLPTGGHVDLDEDPKDTVKRECYEELGIKAEFWLESPLFLTSTATVGLTAGHTDITLWYLLKGDVSMQLIYDRSEFKNISWFGIDNIPYERSDPNIKRFINKLSNKINALPLLRGKRPSHYFIDHFN